MTMRQLKFTTDKLLDALLELKEITIYADRLFIVAKFKSINNNKEYVTTLSINSKTCECKSFLYNQNCKHIQLLAWFLTNFRNMKLEALKRYTFNLNIVSQDRIAVFSFNKGKLTGYIKKLR